jgi:menaquinone-dependent protoporphyrinogen oxidase
MNKILITYATRAGSTAQVAETIAQTLGTTGATVDVRPIKSVTDLAANNAVVIGSAIRFGQWLPEAVEFVKNNQTTLSRIPTAYFVVSGFLREDTPEMRQTVLAYLDPVRKILEPTAIGLFAGKMDYRKLSLLDRGIAALVKQPEGDWRNWDAIRGWARDLQPTLTPA